MDRKSSKSQNKKNQINNNCPKQIKNKKQQEAQNKKSNRPDFIMLRSEKNKYEQKKKERWQNKNYHTELKSKIPSKDKTLGPNRPLKNASCPL